MRKKGIVILLIIVLGALVFVWVSLDRWIENGLEQTGEAIVGARVEIDGFDLNLASLSAGWQRLQIADPENPMQNLVETDRAALRVHGPALLRRRVLIDELTLEGVRSGSPRERDGSLPKKETSKKSGEPGVLDKVRQRLKAEVSNLPVMQFDPDAFQKKLNVDSLVAMADLKTPQRLDSVLTETRLSAEKWKAFAADFHPEDRLKTIRGDLSSIDIQKIKTLPELITTLEKLKTARESFQILQKEVNDARTAVQSDASRLSGYKDAFSRWIDEDMAQVRRMARLPDLSARGIGKQLFGPALISKIDQIMHYVQIARSIAIRKNDSPKKKKREQVGQVVDFPDRLGWPTFLIRNASLSGMTGSGPDTPGLFLKGRAQGLTSQPHIYGKPTLIELAGQNPAGRSLRFRALLDHTTDMISDSLHLNLKNVALSNLRFPSAESGPIRITEAMAGLAGSAWIGNNEVRINLDVDLRNLLFDFSEVDPEDQIFAVAQNILQSVDHLNFGIQLSGPPDALAVDVRSNLDELISEKFGRMANQALEESQRSIRTALTGIGEEKLPGVESALQAFLTDWVNPIDGYGLQVDEIQNLMDDKIKAAEEDMGRRQGDPTGRLKGLLKDLLKKKS